MYIHVCVCMCMLMYMHLHHTIRFEGEWRSDRREGGGTLVYSSGCVDAGVWLGPKLVALPHTYTALSAAEHSSAHTQEGPLTKVRTHAHMG